VDNLAETGAHTYLGARLGIECERWTRPRGRHVGLTATVKF